MLLRHSRTHYEEPERLDPAGQAHCLPHPADARPRQTAWNHYSDPSQQFHVGFWACEPGCWAVHYTEHEYCQMLEGEAVIHDEQGDRLHLKAGDQFVIPAGFVGQWETLTPCRKLYVIFEPAAT